MSCGLESARQIGSGSYSPQRAACFLAEMRHRFLWRPQKARVNLILSLSTATPRRWVDVDDSGRDHVIFHVFELCSGLAEQLRGLCRLLLVSCLIWNPLRHVR